MPGWRAHYDYNSTIDSNFIMVEPIYSGTFFFVHAFKRTKENKLETPTPFSGVCADFCSVYRQYQRPCITMNTSKVEVLLTIAVSFVWNKK